MPISWIRVCATGSQGGVLAAVLTSFLVRTQKKTQFLQGMHKSY